MPKVTENRYLIYDEVLDKDFRYYIRLLKAICREWRYKKLFAKSKTFSPKKYHISICGCFKNEARFFKEWIEYHLLMGVDHFYLYNNNSDDNYQEVLKDYIERGVVTLEEFPEIPAQPGVYQHWYDQYRHETDWVTFLDMDEFFVPMRHDNLKEWLKEHGKYPVLMVYWKMFGTSGIMRHDDTKLVSEQYTVCWPKLDAIGKIFYNTNYDVVKIQKGSHHSLKVWYKGNIIPAMNSYGHFVINDIHRTSSTTPDIQLNHYWSKAFDIYELKHKRGSSAYGKSWKTFDQFCWHENHNTSSDYSIFRFLVQLKLRMHGKGDNVGEE